MNWLKLYWWKLLAALLVLFAIAIGIATPLAPGVVSINPFAAKTSDTFTLNIATVNASFKKHSNNLNIYLISDSIVMKGEQPISNDDNHVQAIFSVPPQVIKTGFNQRFFDLLINSDYDGNVILRSAVQIFPDTSNHHSFSNSELNHPIIIKTSTPVYFSFPMREILYESIRNLFYHVPLWFGMTILLCVSMFYSFRFLRKNNLNDDFAAAAFAKISLLFGLLGILTGMQWAKVTWGSWWNNDPKQNAAAIGMLIYLAYFVLRNSIDDMEKRARISAVFNVFALAIFIPIIYIVPRLTESLHPGNGGNPGFNQYDLDGNLRLVFYPAIIGWTLLGVWMAQLDFRIQKIKWHLLIQNLSAK